MLARTIVLTKCIPRMHVNAVQVRGFVKVGDKVPVSYLKGKQRVGLSLFRNSFYPECFIQTSNLL